MAISAIGWVKERWAVGAHIAKENYKTSRKKGPPMGVKPSSRHLANCEPEEEKEIDQKIIQLVRILNHYPKNRP
jgi:hypothetical protein